LRKGITLGNQAITTILATVLGAILAALVTVWLQHPSDYAVSVDASWVDVPGHGVAFMKKDLKDALDKVENTLGIKGISKIFEDSNLSYAMRLWTIAIKNNDDRRSKDIDILVSNAAAALLVTGVSPSRTISFLSDIHGKPIRVTPLNPGDTVTVVAVSGFSYSTDLPLRVLHGGAALPVTERTIGQFSDAFGGATFVLNRPWIAALALIVVTTVSIIALIILLAATVVNSRFDWMAKAYDRKYISRMFAFTEWIRTHRPDLVPPSSALSASPSISTESTPGRP
jgi:hypothetical protein